MKREHVQIAAACIGNGIKAELLPGMGFVLVLVAPADPGEEHATHAVTATDFPGETVAKILAEVLHAVSVQPEAVVPDGRRVDLTPPKGPAS